VTTVAGRYRLLERLGHGGMGVVWRAHDELLRRDVAVKELHVRLGVDGDFEVRQVLREARAAARLRHPGVVAVHDVVVDDGRPVIVMELVQGRSLAEVVRVDGPLDEDRVADIGVRVLDALGAAHELGVLHRDVKPANILLDGDRVVLTDFGIAAVASDTTLTESAIGSPEYLAPERINGAPASPAADIWSLGVTLCAALRGESPFQRSDTQSTLAAVLTFEPPPIPRAPRLWPVLDALLRKDPAQRPTVPEARDALSGGPPPPKPALPPEPKPRRTRLFALVAALALVIALGVTGSVWYFTKDDAPTTVSAPPGFTGHRGDGFTIAVPSGWFKDSSDQSIHFVSDPHALSNVLAHVEWWDEGHPGGARGVLGEFERGDFTMDFISEYHKIRLDDVTAPQNATSAELEITYHVSMDGDEFDNHELIRATVTQGGRTYVLTIAAQSDAPDSTEQLWQEHEPELTTILDSFQITMP